MISKIVSEYKWKLVFAAVLSALSAGVSLWLISMINGSLAGAGMDDFVLTFLVAIVLLFTLGFFSQWLLARLGTSLVFRIRSLLVERVLGTSYEQLEKIGGHRVHATITTDVNSLSEALAIIPVFVVNLTTILLCFSYLAYLSPIMFTVLFLSLGSGVSLTAYIMYRGARVFTALRESEDGMFSIFKGMVDGSKELSLNEARRSFFLKQLVRPRLEEVKSLESNALTYWVLTQSWASTILFFCLGLLVYFAFAVYEIEIAVLTGFVLFTTYMVGPLNFVMRSFQFLFKGRVAYKKVQSLSLVENQLVDRVTDKSDVSGWGKISVRGLMYRYEESGDLSFSIGPVDFEVSEGEVVFIRGGNGSGKSTFAKALVGLYSHCSGSIHLGDIEVSEKNIQLYRNHFSTIFSDFYLFEHILNSKGELVSKVDVWSHVERLGMADKVDIVDGKLSTIDLSQGQRKRLAMLLACAEDAPIYLFDEWAADQDPIFRSYFYRELLPAFKADGKTVIVISHDDKYFDVADRMYNFELGKAYQEELAINELELSSQ
ncbi:cyclic peptide export ABC transporter [Microbulbifer sp. OS29]|uniref:Cyclic peptide export ABC transporter n=1 Tax=Microbulbifer okhotskensis TaxID=2926617 RepID=A0A9X2J7V7_9GAMM|nr:cyclic peptide export ABC transporter [Microbulbifer okhotskensis]MCO1334906.1 cyclic peptide export ABC transporter [Microbulbifer okhotskensis]